MQLLKSTEKLPSVSFIFEHSWKENKRQLRSILREAIDKEDQYKYDLFKYQNWSWFEDITSDYFERLAEKLSKSIKVDSFQVYAKLEELGL